MVTPGCGTSNGIQKAKQRITKCSLHFPLKHHRYRGKLTLRVPNKRWLKAQKAEYRDPILHAFERNSLQLEGMDEILHHTMMIPQTNQRGFNHGLTVQRSESQELGSAGLSILAVWLRSIVVSLPKKHGYLFVGNADLAGSLRETTCFVLLLFCVSLFWRGCPFVLDSATAMVNGTKDFNYSCGPYPFFPIPM